MVITPAIQGLTPQQWDDKVFMEYVRDSRFNKYMGKDPGAMIQLKTDLTRLPGDTITFAASRRLQGAGVTGDTLLEGNEEIMDLRSMKITVNVLRHGVAVTNWDEQKSAVPLKELARPLLKTWEMEKMRNDIIYSLGSLNGTQFSMATSGQQNGWLTQNYDRVLFGNAKSNNTGTMATSLANVNATTGRLSVATVKLAKRMAKLANPHIRPITTKGDQEWYVMFVPSFAFRDLQADPVFISTYQNAAPRSMDNILFTDDDIVINGTIIREIPEIQTYPQLGASNIDIAPCYMMGAQAIGIAWAQTLRTTENTRDYNFRHGVGLEEIRGIQKLTFGRNTASDTTNLVDQGVMTIYVSGVADN